MADFIYSSRRRPDGDLRRALEAYLRPVIAGCVEYHGTWGSLAVARAPHDGEPVREGGGWLTVLVGEPLVRRDGGAVAAGAGAAALHAHALLRRPGPVGWKDELDGPFAAFGIDLSTGHGTVVTDLAAFIPVFAAGGSRRGEDLVLGTHLDAVALAAGRSDDIDPVSAADLVMYLTCTPPYTLFEGVERLPAASARRFTAAGWGGPAAGYWSPAERVLFSSVDDAAAALRESLLDDVTAVCAGHPKVGLLLSGGEDSRAVLGAVPPDSAVRAFVFGDWESREITVSRRVGAAYGAEVVFGRRAPDHYAAGFEAVASMIGGDQLFSDFHGYGFHESLAMRELPVVLGGLSSDAFLKATHAPPPSSPEAVRTPPSGILRPELVHAVVERRVAFRRELARLRPESWSEWEHLWPFSMRKHAANFHGNRRMFASHEPFQSNGVVEIGAGVPQEWKRRRRLFHAAVRPLLARSWSIPHSRYRFPYFGHTANLPLIAGLRITRGVRAVVTGQVSASHGPWPKWRHLVRSPGIAGLLAENPVESSPIGSIFRPEMLGRVGAAVREEWYPLRELMLLQLAFLTRRAADGAGNSSGSTNEDA